MIFVILQFITKKVPRSIAEVFATLYEEFMPKVFRYMSYRIVDVEMAQDLTESVFEKALVNFNSYSDNKARFSTWLFSIARNTLIDHYRLSETEKTAKKLVMPEDTTDFVDEIAKSEEIKILHTFITQLSPQEREIISLKFGGEMTNRQIARTLGLSESNVGTTIYRTVRKLRDKFKEQHK